MRGCSIHKAEYDLKVIMYSAAHIIDCTLSEEMKSSQARIHLNDNKSRTRNQPNLPFLAQLEWYDSTLHVLCFLCRERPVWWCVLKLMQGPGRELTEWWHRNHHDTDVPWSNPAILQNHKNMGHPAPAIVSWPNPKKLANGSYFRFGDDKIKYTYYQNFHKIN